MISKIFSFDSATYRISNPNVDQGKLQLLQSFANFTQDHSGSADERVQFSSFRSVASSSFRVLTYPVFYWPANFISI